MSDNKFNSIIDSENINLIFSLIKCGTKYNICMKNHIDLINEAIKIRNVKYLEFVMQYFNKNDKHKVKIEDAIIYGNLKCFKLLIEQYNFPLKDDFFTIAAKFNRLPFLVYLFKKSSPCNSKRTFALALKNKHFISAGYLSIKMFGTDIIRQCKISQQKADLKYLCSL